MHFGPISLHEILPDVDKQDSIGEMRSSTSELMKYIFDKGDQMREKSCGLQHIICCCSLCEHGCSIFLPLKVTFRTTA
jgi:hypothetical protein